MDGLGTLEILFRAHIHTALIRRRGCPQLAACYDSEGSCRVRNAFAPQKKNFPTPDLLGPGGRKEVMKMLPHSSIARVEACSFPGGEGIDM